MLARAAGHLVTSRSFFFTHPPSLFLFSFGLGLGCFRVYVFCVCVHLWSGAAVCCFGLGLVCSWERDSDELVALMGLSVMVPTGMHALWHPSSAGWLLLVSGSCSSLFRLLLCVWWMSGWPVFYFGVRYVSVPLGLIEKKNKQ